METTLGVRTVKNLLKLFTPVAAALAFLFAGTSSLASDTGPFSVERALTKLQSDVTKLATDLATLQGDVDNLPTETLMLHRFDAVAKATELAKLQADFAGRGQMAILHAMPNTDQNNKAVAIDGNAAEYWVLGNTIAGAFGSRQFGQKTPSATLTLPDGVYLLELIQPELPSAADDDGNLTAATIADYAECETMAKRPTKWFTVGRRIGSGSGYLPGKCYPATLFFNSPNQTPATRFRVQGGFIYSFTSGVTFAVRFRFRPGMVTAKRTVDSYAATLKITRLADNPPTTP